MKAPRGKCFGVTAHPKRSPPWHKALGGEEGWEASELPSVKWESSLTEIIWWNAGTWPRKLTQCQFICDHFQGPCSIGAKKLILKKHRPPFSVPATLTSGQHWP